jgi:uncharacterized protein
MNNEKYTLITGASNGFGKALALHCASLKMNLILVALPGPELFYLGSFISANYDVKTICFERDLSEEKECHALFNEINRERLSVNILINNAGIGNTCYFEEEKSEFFEKQIRLNAIAPTILSRLFLDNLKLSAPSYILNISSLASFFYLPRKQVYGATKSYLVAFSKSLRRELQKDKISVSVVCPAGMNTNVQVSLLNRSGNWLSRISVANPEEIAPLVIVGMFKGKETIIPGIVGHFYLFLDKLLPAFIKKAITNNAIRRLKPIPRPPVNFARPAPRAA